jgi:FMN-dependent NADH-azoreductase
MSHPTPHLLVIDASPRTARSHSRKLSADYAAAWRAAHPAGKVTTRDLTQEPPPFVTEAWVGGAFAAEDAQSPATRDAIAVSNRYIEELLAADEVLIATPMYNLAVPAALKAWIDQIVRAGRTFAYGAGGYEGLVKGKRVKVIVTSGGDFRPGTSGAGFDFLSPYLRGILGFIGVTDIEFIYAHSLTDGNPQREPSLAAAQETARKLAAAAA